MIEEIRLFIIISIFEAIENFKTKNTFFLKAAIFAIFIYSKNNFYKHQEFELILSIQILLRTMHSPLIIEIH